MIFMKIADFMEVLKNKYIKDMVKLLSEKLDEIDRRILEILKRDAQTPFTDIGRDGHLRSHGPRPCEEDDGRGHHKEVHRRGRRGGFWQKDLRLRSDECEIKLERT